MNTFQRAAVSRPDLSLVLPVYNEEPVIPELRRRLEAFLADVGASWEIIFVDDGSSDGSRQLLSELCASDRRYQLVGLSRNFGHQIAITAGIDYAHGNAIVIMDADLQDPPDVVREMMAKHREGYDVVYGVRRRREKEGVLKRLTAYLYYRVLRMLLGVAIPVDTGDFRLISRRAVMALKALSETHRFVRGMVAWIGFRQTAVFYDRRGRHAGETHYSWRKMLRFAVDGITSFSTAPLRFASWLGVGSGVIGLAIAVFAGYSSLVYRAGMPAGSGIVAAIFLAASAQLLMIGVLGEYVGRIYEEVKRRPLYIVSDELNAHRDQEDLPIEAVPSRISYPPISGLRRATTPGRARSSDLSVAEGP